MAMEFTVQKCRLTGNLRSNHRTIKASARPVSTTSLKACSQQFPFTKHIKPSYQEKITRHTKKQRKNANQSEETEQAWTQTQMWWGYYSREEDQQKTDKA
jgi:hypothetical protein